MNGLPYRVILLQVFLCEALITSNAVRGSGALCDSRMVAVKVLRRDADERTR